METGIVKWFNETKGYGFIKPDSGAEDVFVHISAVRNAGMQTLHENQRISFEIEAGTGGKSSATNLQDAG